MVGTNGISLTNNIVYNTYRAGIVVTGTNNIIRNNLVTSIYWLGTGQIPSVAEFNFNNDAAIMTSDINSVRLLVRIHFHFKASSKKSLNFFYRIIWLLVLNV